MSDQKLLDRVNYPADLKGLSISELEQLAGEIRELLINTVAANGGHLAPSLGVVELTLALHYVFDTPKDKLVWDVGHQAYVHKIITGRKKYFNTLRQFKGCLGFLSRDESKYDAFGGGHAGTAISAAVGMAVARDRAGSDEHIVAIVGDGALGCGISLEGLNNVSSSCRGMVIVLNDNNMSISKNVGAISRNLSHLISGRSYNRFKAWAKMLLRKVPHGEDIRRGIRRLEEVTKGVFVPGMLFEELGIRYVGPIDGHRLEDLIVTLQGAKDFKHPVVIHAITEKGRGYSPAESAPEKYHGLSSFDPATGMSNGKKTPITFSEAFGQAMCDMCQKHSNISVITAGMASGTGLSNFAEKFPSNFHDVGIAEEHAVVFAAGLAASGCRPVVAIYATFMQRALDCIFHDVCLQNLPVIFCLDRAGIVEDGPTHHGIHDLSFLLNMPNLAILAPWNELELKSMLNSVYERKMPVVIRYPRGWSGCEYDSGAKAGTVEWGRAEVVREGSDVAIWAVNREVCTALKAAQFLKDKYGFEAKVVNTRFLLPFDTELLEACAGEMPVVTIEDCQIKGGLGAVVDEALINFEHKGVTHFGWGQDIVPHGDIDMIRESVGLIPENIAAKVADLLKN